MEAGPKKYLRHPDPGVLPNHFWTYLQYNVIICGIISALQCWGLSGPPEWYSGASSLGLDLVIFRGMELGFATCNTYI